MKNLFKIMFLTLGLLVLQGCDEKADQTSSTKSSDELLNRRICPDGQQLVVTVSWHFDIFEKFDGLTCKNGWGLCFQAGPVWNFECVRIRSIVAARVSFDLQTNSGTAIGIPNEESKKCTFYFHKNIMNSSLYQNKEFETLSIGPDLYIDDTKTKKLVQGSYPIIIDGDYFKYDVDYVQL